MRCEHLHDSAVYVLGALSPPEHEAYERHLAECAECRAEVAQFSDLPGLLSRLDPEIAAQIALASSSDLAPSSSDPASASAGSASAGSASAGSASVSAADGDLADPAGGRRLGWAGPTAVPSSAAWAGPTVAEPSPDRINGAAADPLLPRVLDRARSTRRTERRRRRWQTAGTALVAAFLGVLAVVGVRAAGVDQPDYVAMQEVAGTVPVTASLALAADSGGTVVRMRCAYKAGEGNEYAKWTYKLVVVPKSGTPEEINTWTARAGDEMLLTAHTDIRRTDIQRLEIRKADGTPLLTLAA